MLVKSAAKTIGFFFKLCQFPMYQCAFDLSHTWTPTFLRRIRQIKASPWVSRSTTQLQLKVYTVHPEIQANTRPEVYQLFSWTFKQRKNCGTALKHYVSNIQQKQTDMKLATINILEGVGIPMLGFQSTQPDLNVTNVVRVFTWRVGNLLRQSFSSKSGKTNIILGLCRCFEVHLPRWIVFGSHMYCRERRKEMWIQNDVTRRKTVCTWWFTLHHNVTMYLATIVVPY